MHKVLQSYLRIFVEEHGLEAMSEADQFERFVNFCIISQVFPDQFDLESITTSDSDPSIDGIAVMLGEDMVTTVEEAKSVIGDLTGRRSIEARYIFCQAKRSSSFDAGEMLKFGSGVLALFETPPRTSDDVVDEFLAIHSFLFDSLGKIQNGRPSISLYFVTSGVWNEASGLQEQAVNPTVLRLKSLGLFHDSDFAPVDREKLIRLWNRSREPVSATFDVKGTVALPTIGNVTEAYLALARASEFVNQVLSGDDGRIRASVFEQNVRAFLGEDNDVNARMAKALSEPERHDRFAINNNGITIVAPDVRVQSDRVSVSDFQIVNGCQTSHVLFRHRHDLTDSVWVPLKIIEASDPGIVAQLVESTNSQTAIENAQFISIRPFAQRLEDYFKAVGQENSETCLHFERRTNQYAGTGITKMRVFDIQKLARAFAAMFLNLPHLAYMYPKQVLRERKEQLFRASHSEHAYHTAALALYRLDLVFANRYVPRAYQGYKWHILMLFRFLYAGSKMPRFESNKFDGYCDKIDALLSQGGKNSAPPFAECVKIIKQVGEATKDRRKGQRYTSDLLEAVSKTKKKQSKKAAKK